MTITQNSEIDDQPENEENITSHKYCYNTSTNNKKTDISVPHSLFLSNINNISESPIENDVFINKEFDHNDIDYMATVFYTHKQDIEKIHTYHQKN